MKKKITIYRYTATSDHEPDNYYKYAAENGSCEPVWTYDTMIDALQALQELETTCERTDGKYKIMCYAMEVKK